MAITYPMVLDELNLVQSSLEETIYSAAEKRKKFPREEVIDEMLEWLLMAYIFGKHSADQTLYPDITASKPGIDMSGKEKEAAETVYVRTEGRTFEDRINDYADAYDRGELLEPDIVTLLSTIAETEGHRVYHSSLISQAKENEKSLLEEGLAENPLKVPQGVKDRIRTVTDYPSGIVLKVWNTILDDRVRDTHAYLEGAAVPLDDRFYTYDGDSALAPGGFKEARNNINCRCWLSIELA